MAEGWGSAIGKAFKWIDNKLKKRNDQNEMDVTKAAMSGDESAFNNGLNRLLGKQKKRK